MADSKLLAATPSPVSGPKRLRALLEIRAAFDVGSMLLPLAASQFTRQKKDQGQPIILLPGFASDERYLKPLGRYLQNQGYSTEGWGLGVNMAGFNYKHKLEDLSPRWELESDDDFDPANYKGEGGVAYLCDQAIARIEQRAKELQQPVILIGWSLGGYIAREVARELPNEVAQVITLGSPIIGGPKYTAAASFFESRGIDLDWIERAIHKRDAKPIQQPITAIYSKSDGVVNWHATIDKVSPNAHHIEVNSSHLGMGFNQKIWRHIICSIKFQQGHLN